MILLSNYIIMQLWYSARPNTALNIAYLYVDVRITQTFDFVRARMRYVSGPNSCSLRMISCNANVLTSIINFAILASVYVEYVQFCYQFAELVLLS